MPGHPCRSGVVQRYAQLGAGRGRRACRYSSRSEPCVGAVAEGWPSHETAARICLTDGLREGGGERRERPERCELARAALA